MADAKVQKHHKFEDVFAVLRGELLAVLRQEGMPRTRRLVPPRTPSPPLLSRCAYAWLKLTCLNLGLSVVDSVGILQGRVLGEDEYFKAVLLGWCIELLQVFFLVSEDTMDQSVTPCGQPCWYRVEGVSHITINDLFMLEGAIYFLLKKHFRTEPYHVHFLELFHDTTFQTELGQLIDLITAPEDHVELGEFSLEKHQKIVIYKTAYYSFYLPVVLLMYMTSIPHTTQNDPYVLAQSILIPLGEYFQIGTDIVDNKCLWCVNTALALANPVQHKVLDSNYGRKDTAAEAHVKALYEELGIRARGAAYEDAAYKRIVAFIETIPEKPQAKAGEVVAADADAQPARCAAALELSRPSASCIVLLVLAGLATTSDSIAAGVHGVLQKRWDRRPPLDALGPHGGKGAGGCNDTQRQSRGAPVVVMQQGRERVHVSRHKYLVHVWRVPPAMGGDLGSLAVCRVAKRLQGR
ncbi:hypothetical protein VTO73DRAFT_14513 [Trametes versicolor]